MSHRASADTFVYLTNAAKLIFFQNQIKLNSDCDLLLLSYCEFQQHDVKWKYKIKLLLTWVTQDLIDTIFCLKPNEMLRVYMTH